MAQIDTLEALVFYAIDLASPYDLALHSSTNGIAKIQQYSLAELQITPQGLKDMWQTINGYARQYHGNPVPADRAIRCRTVSDVWQAVQAAANS